MARRVMGLTNASKTNTFELSGDVRDPNAVVMARIRKAREGAGLSERDGPPKDVLEGAEQGLHALADVIRKFPGDTASVAYSVACEFSYADTETLEDTERPGVVAACRGRLQH